MGIGDRLICCEHMGTRNSSGAKWNRHGFGWLGKVDGWCCIIYIGVLGSKRGSWFVATILLGDFCMGNYKDHIMAVVSARTPQFGVLRLA